MSRREREVKITEKVPAPFNYIYTDRDPEEERLVSALMLAGKEIPHKADPNLTPDKEQACFLPTECGNADISEDYGGLVSLLEHIQAHLTQDLRLTALLARLPEYFGEGDMLRVLFCSLFPQGKTAQTLNADNLPILSEREREVLREAAGDRSQKEIAQRLGITVRTVNTHFDNIYKKLGVQRPMQAVARAVALGYLDIDALNILESAGNSHRNFGLLNTLFNSIYSRETPGPSAQTSLAGFGLLLLTLSATAKQASVEEAEAESRQPGILCALDPMGEIIQRFDTAPFGLCGDFAIAPPQAAQHGFTPGNLFVSVYYTPTRGLNTSAIAEFTPEGRYVRAFCGGQEVGTRLTPGNGLVFDTDGRLLATSGWLTDAVLIFTEGGRKVRRFANGCFRHIVAQGRKIYAVQSSTVGSLIKVFDSGGELLETIGGTLPGGNYSALGLTSGEHLIVGREKGSGILDEYDPNRRRVRSFAVAGFLAGRIAIDDQDRLYIPCHHANSVKIVRSDGSLERRLNLRQMVKPSHLVLGTDNRIWVSGLAP